MCLGMYVLFWCLFSRACAIVCVSFVCVFICVVLHVRVAVALRVCACVRVFARSVYVLAFV